MDSGDQRLRRRTRPPRLILTVLQIILALLVLIRLGSLSSTQCWYNEPSERIYLWWLAPSTVIVSVADYYLEAYEIDILIRTGLDAITTIFWLGGIGAAGQLHTLTAEIWNCYDDGSGPYPETGLIIAFAVFELILFAVATYHARNGLPWLRSNNDASNCENATRPGGRTPASHLRSGDFSEYITVHVGEGDGKKDYPVAKGPLCRRSKFVRSATSDTWTIRLGKASKAKEVDLEDDDPEAFETYLQCVMGNSVVVKDLDVTHPTRIQSDDGFMRLISAYILADKLGDPESMNLVIDRLAQYSLAVRRIPNIDAVTCAYESTVKGSPLRLILVDLYHVGFDRERTRERDIEGMPNEFLVQYTHARPLDVQTVVPGSQRYHVSTRG